jgi:hypothetical protein
MDPDPDLDQDPGFSSLTFKMLTKNKFKKNFVAYYFLKVHLHNFSKIKCPKEVTKQNSRNQGFSYYFCLMIEGSGSPDPYL